jgi:hypothetical protein
MVAADKLKNKIMPTAKKTAKKKAAPKRKAAPKKKLFGNRKPGGHGGGR